jgi:hypothetical protein
MIRNAAMKTLVFVLVLASTANHLLAQSLSNPQSTSKTREIYKKLQTLRTQKDRNRNRLILGQHAVANRPGQSDFDVLYWKLAQSQKPVRHLGLLGWSVSRTNSYDTYFYEDNTDLSVAVDQAALYSEREKCWISLTWHARNPWNGPDRWTGPPELKWKAGTAGDKRGPRGGKIDLKSLLPAKASRPEGEFRKQWLILLNEMADGLDKLQQQGHTVLWRPFHEMNGETSQGGFFWWSNQNGKDFQELWIDMFDHFTKARKLNNLIWVWAPFNSSGHKPYLDYYPGGNYVDLVGIDVYQNPSGFSIGDLDWLRERSEKDSKPVIIAEIGPSPLKDQRVSFKDYLVHLGRREYDFFVALMAWNDWDSDEDANRTLDTFCSIYENSVPGDNVLNHPMVVTKEEL